MIQVRHKVQGTFTPCENLEAQMRLLVALICMFGLAYATQASVVIMAEKGFPPFLANQMLSPWELGRDFEACGSSSAPGPSRRAASSTRKA